MLLVSAVTCAVVGVNVVGPVVEYAVPVENANTSVFVPDVPFVKIGAVGWVYRLGLGIDELVAHITQHHPAAKVTGAEFNAADASTELALLMLQ